MQAPRDLRRDLRGERHPWLADPQHTCTPQGAGSVRAEEAVRRVEVGAPSPPASSMSQCPPAAGLEAWCGDPLWLLETQVPSPPASSMSQCPPAAGLEAWCGDPLWVLETQVPLTPSIIHEPMPPGRSDLVLAAPPQGLAEPPERISLLAPSKVLHWLPNMCDSFGQLSLRPPARRRRGACWDVTG